MDEINIALNKFIQSVNNKNDINTMNNNLALLIAKMNIFYYKNNFFNNAQSCNENNLSLTLAELEKVAEQIRNIYPKFMELKKENFKNVYINKLNCNKTPGELLKNIDKSNKVQSIITDLSDLLYFKTSDVPEMILTNTNITSESKSKSSNKLFIYLLIGALVLLFIILIIYIYKNHKKQKKVTPNIKLPKATMNPSMNSSMNAPSMNSSMNRDMDMGNSGMGNAGMGNAGMGNAGMGNAGMGNDGMGDMDMGNSSPNTTPGMNPNNPM
jgi:hypothetical protein